MNATYLNPGFYCDSNHPDVVAYAHEATKNATSIKDKLVELYYAVRDGFAYSPYKVILKPYALKASFLLTKDYGYCIEKSNLYAACARILGVPSRLGFANVRNHLGTKKLEQYLKTDLLAFHGYVEIFLEDKWIKATPVFDKNLCAKMGVEPLEFDAEKDSIFQKSDKKGQPFMEYVDDLGVHADVPFEAFVAEMQKQYPHLFDRQIRTERFTFEFE